MTPVANELAIEALHKSLLVTCPIVWLPTYSEEQAFYERL
jgi:hypothetical protein